MADAPKWKICWITGATGGIGAELSRQLAQRGVKVAATARSADKLNALADAHPNITAFSADVTDAEALKAAVAKIESDLGPIDLAIFAAGVYAPFDAENIDLEGFHRTSAVNIDGVANSLAAVLPAMQSRGRGQLGIMGSLFGYCGLPGNGSYGASKAYLINLAQSLELELAPKGIDVTLINPGFVDTPLNASYDRPKYFVIKPSKAARRIIEGLEKGGFEVAFPGRVAAFFKTAKALPNGVLFWLLRRGLMRD